MHMPPKKSAVLIALLLPLLMASGCATKSQPLPPPVVGEKPTAQPLPSNVAAIAPPPSGYYWEKLTNWRKSLQTRLSSMPVKSEPSSGSPATTAR